MASRFAESVSDYTPQVLVGPSKPKRASESKLINWKNAGDEVDEGQPQWTLHSLNLKFKVT